MELLGGTISFTLKIKHYMDRKKKKLPDLLTIQNFIKLHLFHSYSYNISK